jgi:hypothetical protein
LISADEGKGRSKRHLEARMDDRFRHQQHHRERRDRDGAHGERCAVDHDSHQHHRDHDEGALGRDFGAGQREIEGRGQERDRRRQFLDRVAQRKARNQRETGAHEKDHDARDQRHVKPVMWRALGLKHNPL